ncbi:hypothetical protein LLG46_12015 [bacterium]|nr:hypothetical protein [bacterium]
MSTDYTIIVSTCDAYEDVWYPFFKLFSKYWPDCRQRILLTTEEKEFSYGQLKIDCAKVGKSLRGRSLPWGECMIRSLSRVDSPTVLMILEDFFLCGNVDAGQIESLVDVMVRMKCTHIGLTQYAKTGPFHTTDDPMLWNVDRKADYRINLQAGLWDTTGLRGHLRSRESAWDMEIWGSIRAQKMDDLIMCVNKDWLSSGKIPPIVPYVSSGIRHGRWERHVVVDLFRSHGIDMDFSKRGFTDELPADTHLDAKRLTLSHISKSIRCRCNCMMRPIVRYMHLR